jgi:hypothetical protein
VEEMERDGAWIRARVRDAARCRRPCMAAAAAAVGGPRGRSVGVGSDSGEVRKSKMGIQLKKRRCRFAESRDSQFGRI